MSEWPPGESDGASGASGASGAPPPPPGDSEAGQAPSTSGQGFVNPPEPAPPPPPPAGAQPPQSDPPPPPPDGTDAGWQPTPTGPDDEPEGSSKRTLWWVLGGLAVLAVLGVLAVLLVLRSTGLSPDDLGRVGEGSAERLAELHSGCEAGDMQACDDLYLEAPFDSEEEAFGDSCGGRNEPAGWCVDVHGETAPD